LVFLGEFNRLLPSFNILNGNLVPNFCGRNFDRCLVILQKILSAIKQISDYVCDGRIVCFNVRNEGLTGCEEDILLT
jgi:hypothetical protein